MIKFLKVIDLFILDCRNCSSVKWFVFELNLKPNSSTNKID